MTPQSRIAADALAARPDDDALRPRTSYEALVCVQPFVVRKRVRWADCDPAGVVFTGKFSEYLLVAAGYFFDHLGQGHYAQWLESMDVDAPCKGLDLAFHGALWPEDTFDMTCTVSAMRESSYDLRVEAAQADGRRIFTGRFSPVCISRTVRKRVPMPLPMRQALAPYCTAAGMVAAQDRP